MGLREIESKLPPGFRFYPSDEELVCHYLCKKICRERVWEGTLVEVDLHTCEPWELPEVAKLSANEWYFFSFRDRKYSTGSRTNRATKTGYWKATGKDRSVQDPNTHAVVGMRKTLVFYCGRAPNGVKTGWVMHEFRLETPHVPPKEDWVLCRVFSKMKGESTATSGQDNEQQDGYVGYSSPIIDDFSSAMQLDVDQLPTFVTPFPTQPEDLDIASTTNMPRLQHNNYLHIPAAQEMQYYDNCFAGFGGPPRPEDDGYGFLVRMGLGDHGAAAGSSTGHGMGSC